MIAFWFICCALTQNNKPVIFKRPSDDCFILGLTLTYHRRSDIFKKTVHSLFNDGGSQRISDENPKEASHKCLRVTIPESENVT